MARKRTKAQKDAHNAARKQKRLDEKADKAVFQASTASESDNILDPQPSTSRNTSAFQLESISVEPSPALPTNQSNIHFEPLPSTSRDSYPAFRVVSVPEVASISDQFSSVDSVPLTKKEQINLKQRERRQRETLEKRNKRLNDKILDQQRRLDQETPEVRDRRLEQMAIAQEARIEEETEEQRLLRLNSITTNRREQHLRETSPERSLRLADKVIAEQERHSLEGLAERAKRLEERRIRRLELVRRNFTEIQERRYVHRGSRMYLTACDYNTVIEQNNIGPLSIVCLHCHSLSFKSENVHCCKKGKIRLTSYKTPTPIILSLFDGSHERSKSFLKHIRLYNTKLSFASFVCNPIPLGRGNSTFVLQGTVYRMSSSVISNDNPSFAQLYILDPEAAALERSKNIEACNADLLEALSVEISSVSPLVSAYRQMYEIVRDQERRNAEEGRREIEQVHMWMMQNTRDDSRRYNAPTDNQIAIVIDTPDGEIDRSRGVSVYSRYEPGSHYIKSTSPLLDSLLYPMFFPHGDFGWTHQMPYEERGARRNYISMAEYYAHRIQVRKDEINILHRGRNLFQQFLVDVYTRVEGSRTDYIRLNQKELRIDMYQGLLDYVSRMDPENGPPGRAVILPSTFTGGPRYLQQQFQDAIAMVVKKGRPDLFITMTANPKWPEITDNLLPGQYANSRPDIVARVFQLKVKELMNDIVKKEIFGKLAAYSYSIEWQKRGNPHVHLLIILDPVDKIVGSSEIIDAIVSAEIPDPETDATLHALVTQHMMHGPCGEDNPTSPCMQKSKTNVFKCQKRFPKSWQDVTEFTYGSYPVYKRRNDGITVSKRGTVLDNRWVVPYNRYLMKKFNCHLNVEVCSSIACVKYLYKYFYKGGDRASVRISTNDPTVQTPVLDEVQNFIDARYIAAPEAAWRLFGYKLCDKSHTIMLLSVHLPDQQMVTFTAGEEDQAAEIAGETTLTAWFKLNERSPPARVFKYTDIPEKYVFVARKWQSRQRKLTTIMARMPLINPNQGEKFYLRLLLLHVAGATSFEDLRTVDGELRPTFKAAALSRGLLEDDAEWENTMREAETFQMPRQLRNLFASILAFCSPQDPQKLWNTFADSMSQRLQPPETAREIALALIDRKLHSLGRSLAEFGFAIPSPSVLNGLHNERDPTVEAVNSEILMQQLNSEQRHIIDAVLDAVRDNRGACFFLDGPGGTGKTFVYNTLIQLLNEQNIPVKAVASTGIAATLLKDGQTAHSTFKIPIPTVNTTTSSMTRFSPAGQSCIATKVVIWDEAPMQHRFVLESVNRLFQDLMRNTLPFGNKIMLLGGDFRQILPVIRGGSRETCVSALITRSQLWQHFTIFQLTSNMRLAPGQSQFAAYLLSIGNREANEEYSDNVIVPPESICSNNRDFVNNVFGELISNAGDLSSVAILCPHNDQSLLINEDVLKLMPGVATQYFSMDTLESDEHETHSIIPVEFLYEITPSGMPPHILNIKKGSIVMLLRNMHVGSGLCNGTRLEVLEMLPHLLLAKILLGPHKGERVFLPRMNLQPSDGDLQIRFTRRQFPVRLAFSITINKAQGQTFTNIGIDLTSNVFSHGQYYVALSRATRLSDLKIRLPIKEKKTKNIVYLEALL